MKVAQKLVVEGYVESVLGRGGGLKLAKTAKMLNVGNIVRTLEDTGNFVECFNASTNRCLVTEVCALHDVLAGGVDMFMSYLDQFTVADLITDSDKFRLVLETGPSSASQ